MATYDLSAGEHPGELFRALILGRRRLLLPTQSVRQIDLEPHSDTPIYALDENFEIATQYEAPCAVQIRGEQREAVVLCDRLDLLFGDLHFQTLPACMTTPDMPIAALSMREEDADWVCSPDALLDYLAVQTAKLREPS